MENNQFNEKGLAGIGVVLVVILVALISGGGIYAWQANKSTSEKAQLQSQITSLQSQLNQQKTTPATTPTTTTPTTTTTTDETADWKTYTNEKYGYSFKYPKGWIVASYSKDEDVVLSDQPGGHWLFGVRVSSNTDNLSLETIANKEADKRVKATGENLSKADISSLKLGGLEAKQIVVSPVGDYGNTEVVSIKGKNIIEIPGDTSTQENKNIFEGILSTFQFTK